MSAHAPLSPSSAKRWMACPGSVPLSAPLPDSPASVYSAEGTWMHEIGETALRHHLADWPSIGDTKVVEGHELTWDMSMDAAVRFYVDYCRNLSRHADTTMLWIEERVVVVKDRVWGTADFVVWHPDRRHLDVVDLKGGRGVVVEPESEQLMIYGLGAGYTNKLKPVTVHTHIVQPRASGGDTPRIAEWTWLDLVVWHEAVLASAVARIDAGDSSLVVGDHCRFCPAKSVCPELHRTALQAAKMDFGKLPPEPLLMNDDDLGFAMAQAEVMKTWIDAVRAEISARLDRGVTVPGWKLVPKRATRQWRDMDQAEKWLQRLGLAPDDMFDTKLKSVAQIAKIVGKPFAEIEDMLVVKESTGSTLAPESDPRDQVLAGPQHEFSAVTLDS